MICGDSNRFAELQGFAQYYGFKSTARGADCVFRHHALPTPVMIGQPHGGRDRLWPHDVERFVEAIEVLVEMGLIRDLEGSLEVTA